MSSVEIREAVSVGREVRRHPVEDHCYAPLMQVVNQIHEILRSSVARCGREIPSGLISPGPVERMFHHRQEFDVSEAHARNVLSKTRRGFAIGERTIMFLWNPHPGTEVNFV